MTDSSPDRAFIAEPLESRLLLTTLPAGRVGVLAHRVA